MHRRLRPCLTRKRCCSGRGSSDQGELAVGQAEARCSRGPGEFRRKDLPVRTARRCIGRSAAQTSAVTGRTPSWRSAPGLEAVLGQAPGLVAERLRTTSMSTRRPSASPCPPGKRRYQRRPHLRRTRTWVMSKPRKVRDRARRSPSSAQPGSLRRRRQPCADAGRVALAEQAGSREGALPGHRPKRAVARRWRYSGGVAAGRRGDQAADQRRGPRGGNSAPGAQPVVSRADVRVCPRGRKSQRPVLVEDHCWTPSSQLGQHGSTTVLPRPGAQVKVGQGRPWKLK